jgi:hypothetical protein
MIFLRFLSNKLRTTPKPLRKEEKPSSCKNFQTYLQSVEKYELTVSRKTEKVSFWRRCVSVLKSVVEYSEQHYSIKQKYNYYFRNCLWRFAKEPFHSETSPFHLQTYPAQSVKYPAQSETYPAQSETYPAQSETYPAQSETYPAQSVKYPAQSKTYPAQSVKYPAQSKTYPTQSKTYPTQTSKKKAQKSTHRTNSHILYTYSFHKPQKQKTRFSLYKIGNFIWGKQISEYQHICLILENPPKKKAETKKTKNFVSIPLEKIRDLFFFEPNFQRPPPK